MDDAELDETYPWDEFSTTTAFVMRSILHTILDASPTKLVFGRDIILPIQYKEGWVLITQKKQKRIDKSNRREYSKQLDIEYKAEDLVFLNKPGILPKLTLPRVSHT